MEDFGAVHRAGLSDRRTSREALLPGSVTTGIVLLWIAALVTLYTGWDYMKASYDNVGGD